MSEERYYTQREMEDRQAASNRVSEELDNVDVELAKAAPGVYYMAGLCRDYYEALKENFYDEEKKMSLVADERIVQILVGTIGLIKTK